MRKAIAVSMGIVFLASTVSAAPVRFIQDQTDEPGILGSFYDGKLILSLGAEYDHVFGRELDVPDSEDLEAEFGVAGGELALEYDHNIKVYGTLGQAMNLEASGTISGIKVSADFDDTLIWGVGIAGKSKDISWIDVFADIGYRQMADAEYDSITVDGTRYTASELDVTADQSWREWHVATGVSKTFAFLTPYAGVRYSDLETSGRASSGADEVDLGDADAEHKVGVFAGLIFSPATNVHFGVQGRFIDEEAVSGSATITF